MIRQVRFRLICHSPSALKTTSDHSRTHACWRLASGKVQVECGYQPQVANHTVKCALIVIVGAGTRSREPPRPPHNLSVDLGAY